nr:Brix-domain-containing protein [Cryptomonas sp.]
MEYSPLVLVISNKIKNKRFFRLVIEFNSFIYLYSVNGLPNPMEEIILKFPSISCKLGFSHVIIFSEKKSRQFIQISGIPRGPSVTFYIVKFAIRREISLKCFKNDVQSMPLLLFNDFSYKKEKLLIIYGLIRQLFPNTNINRNFLKKISKSVLFELDPKLNKVEVRVYQIQGIMPIIPRHLRKYKKNYYSKSDKNYEYEVEKTNTELCTSKSRYLSLVRMVEIGPRITMKVINILDKKTD